MPLAGGGRAGENGLKAIAITALNGLGLYRDTVY